MSRERITRDDWNRAINVLCRGIEALQEDVNNYDPEYDGELRNELESAKKVLRRLIDTKVNP